jgi:hypothetical protein
LEPSRKAMTVGARGCGQRHGPAHLGQVRPPQGQGQCDRADVRRQHVVVPAHVGPAELRQPVQENMGAEVGPRPQGVEPGREEDAFPEWRHAGDQRRQERDVEGRLAAPGRAAVEHPQPGNGPEDAGCPFRQRAQSQQQARGGVASPGKQPQRPQRKYRHQPLDHPRGAHEDDEGVEEERARFSPPLPAAPAPAPAPHPPRTAGP